MTREEAINMLYGIRSDNLNLDDAYTKDKYEALEIAIKALEQEPITGQWIDISNDEFRYHRIYKCSNCGDTICDYPEDIHKYKRCYNCGALMKSEVDND